MSFGEKLSSLRANKGLTQQELADILNDQYDMKVSKGRVSNWESGKNYPALITSMNIAEIFKIDVNYFRKDAGPLEDYKIDNETNAQIINKLNKLSPKRRRRVIEYMDNQLGEQEK